MLEKLFLSSKWFVVFCALFIVVWLALQVVSNMRLENESQIIGNNLFSWTWPERSWESRGDITKVSILQKTDNDAVVEVIGKQTLLKPPETARLDREAQQSETVDCSAKLTLYRRNNKWVLGRVEL